jgi:nitrate/nitrite transporter NarK
LFLVYRVFFERKFDFTPDNANTVNSMVYIISAVASPLLGLLVDKVGKNVFWVFISILASIGCHALLAFTFVNPYVAMVRTTSFIVKIFCMHLHRNQTGSMDILRI